MKTSKGRQRNGFGVAAGFSLRNLVAASFSLRSPTLMFLIRNLKVAATFALLCFPLLSFADNGGLREPVLSLGLGARSLGLGGAYAAVADDVEAIATNPAGLKLVSQMEATAVHQTLFEGTSYDALAVAMPTLHWGTIGLAMMRLSSGEGEQRDATNKLLGTFREQDMAAKVAWAERFGPHLCSGVAITYLKRSLANASNGFYSLDVGLWYKPFGNLKLGAAVQNIFSRKFGDTDDTLDLDARLGASYELLENGLILAADVAPGQGGRYHVGIEYSGLGLVSLRAGQDNIGRSLGLGFNFNRYRLDYSMGIHSLGNTQRLSFSVKFGKKMKKRMMEYGRAMRSRANVFLEEGLYSEAIKRLEESRRYIPFDKEPEKNLAKLREVAATGITQITQQDALGQTLRRCVGLYTSGNITASFNAFKEVRHMDKDHEAVKKLASLYESQPGVAPRSGLSLIQLKLYQAQQYFVTRQYEEAAKECWDVIEIDPKNALAYVRLGSAYFAMRMPKEAISNWQKAILIDPNLPEVKEAKEFMEKVLKYQQVANPVGDATPLAR